MHPNQQQSNENELKRKIETEECDKNKKLKNVSAITSHYNSRDDVGKEKRKESPILNLKNFNNWIKSVLIKTHVQGEGCSVLDLGGGKGGDLLKWNQAKIGHLVLIGRIELLFNLNF